MINLVLFTIMWRFFRFGSISSSDFYSHKKLFKGTTFPKSILCSSLGVRNLCVWLKLSENLSTKEDKSHLVPAERNNRSDRKKYESTNEYQFLCIKIFLYFIWSFDAEFSG